MDPAIASRRPGGRLFDAERGVGAVDRGGNAQGGLHALKRHTAFVQLSFVDVEAGRAIGHRRDGEGPEFEIDLVDIGLARAPSC